MTKITYTLLTAALFCVKPTKTYTEPGMCPQSKQESFTRPRPSLSLNNPHRLAPGLPAGGLEAAGPESPPIQPSDQAVGGEVHPLPSSG